MRITLTEIESKSISVSVTNTPHTNYSDSLLFLVEGAPLFREAAAPNIDIKKKGRIVRITPSCSKRKKAFVSVMPPYHCHRSAQAHGMAQLSSYPAQAFCSAPLATCTRLTNRVPAQQCPAAADTARAPERSLQNAQSDSRRSTHRLGNTQHHTKADPAG